MRKNEQNSVCKTLKPFVEDFFSVLGMNFPSMMPPWHRSVQKTLNEKSLRVFGVSEIDYSGFRSGRVL